MIIYNNYLQLERKIEYVDKIIVFKKKTEKKKVFKCDICFSFANKILLQIPVIFSLSRREIGIAVGRKQLRPSVVGVISYQGAEQQFKKTVRLWQKVRQATANKLSKKNKT